MIKLKSILIEISTKTFFHVTTAKNLTSIKKTGLVPKKGSRSSKLESSKAVYLFSTRSDAEDAVMNWLGDEFPEKETLYLLRVSLPIIEFNPKKVAFEYQVSKVIPSKYISVVGKI